MRRRKPQTLQVNVRLDAQIVDELTARAKANRVSFSEEARERLIDSLNPPGLHGFRAGWVARLRDAIEAGAKPEDIEERWRCLQGIDAEFAVFCGKAESALSLYISDARVRELLRGRPATLPDETTSKQKP